MSQPKYQKVAPEVEEMYWEHAVSEICSELDIGSSTYQRARDYVELPKKTNANHLEWKYGVPTDWLLHTLHNILDKSVKQMSEELPVSRYWIQSYMGDSGIPRRGQSEAEELKWAQMSEEARRQQVRAAHEASRESPRLDVSKRGYERIRHGGNELKHHRLLATLLINELEDLEDLAVHHEMPVWPDGPDKVAQAVNFLDNIEVLDHAEHMRQHVESGDIPRDEVTGQFKYER
jgi:hypothetical protein